MSAPKIPDGPEWDDVRDAFRMASRELERDLDPSKPEHWLLVVKFCQISIKAYHKTARALAEEYFKKQPGRQQEWTAERLIKLVDDIARLRHEHPGKLESDLCRFLSRKEDYKGLNAGTLRRKLQDAKAPECSWSLAQLIERSADEFWEGKDHILNPAPPEPPAAAPFDQRVGIKLVKK